jgi:hypothetical protein
MISIWEYGWCPFRGVQRLLPDGDSRRPWKPQPQGGRSGQRYATVTASLVETIVAVYEAPDDAVSARFTLMLGEMGNVQTETRKAFPESAFREIIHSMGPELPIPASSIARASRQCRLLRLHESRRVALCIIQGGARRRLEASRMTQN